MSLIMGSASGQRRYAVVAFNPARSATVGMGTRSRPFSATSLGQLAIDAGPEELATALIAATEGGLVLSQPSRMIQPLAMGLKSRPSRVTRSVTPGLRRDAAGSGELEH